MKQLNVATEYKAIGDSGSFEGYAAVFGNIDLGGDILERDAIKEIVKLRNGKVAILNQHRQTDPIGLADVSTDDKGLHFKGQLVLEAASARSAHALMKAGALDGMSFGYDVLPGGAEMLKSGVRQLKAIKVWEISPVTFGMNPAAGIDSVKAIVENGQLPSLSDFEGFLREAGFSKSQATAIAGRGLKYLHDRSESGEAGAGELQKLLGSFRIPE